MHPVKFVGDDAHIVPKPYGTTRHVEWNGGMEQQHNISPFNRVMEMNHPRHLAPPMGELSSKVRLSGRSWQLWL